MRVCWPPCQIHPCSTSFSGLERSLLNILLQEQSRKSPRRQHPGSVCCRREAQLRPLGAQGSQELTQTVTKQGLGYQGGSCMSLTRGQQPIPAAFQPALLCGERERGLQS